MKAGFADVVRKLFKEQGLGVLDDLGRCRGLLQDYAAGKYKPEARLFMTMLEAGFHRRLLQEKDSGMTAGILRQILESEYLIVPSAAEEMVGLLAEVLGKPVRVLPSAPAPSAPASKPDLSAEEMEALKALLAEALGKSAPKPAPSVPKPVPKPASAPKPAPAAVPGGFVRIPAGTFIMGSPVTEPKREDDEIQHRVTVRSFCMSKYPVTQEEYQNLTGDNPSYFKGYNLPVECVSWLDAVKYCNIRSQREGLTPAYIISGSAVTWDRKAQGYRLPTEAEWEYACRAGTTTPYYTGNSLDRAGWYWDNRGGTTHPVGEKEPNKFGLYDMHGNVWEWCWDWYGAYDIRPQTDPVGPATGLARVCRGGSQYNDGGCGRSAFRKLDDPAARDYDLGFRLVCP